LTCKVVKEEPGKLFATRLWVEVSNTGPLAAEPLEFLVRQEPKSVKGNAGPFETTVARAAFPFAARYGRPAPAGGKNRYWLQAGSARDDVQWSVKVTRAAWPKGGVLPKPDVQVGAIEAIPMKDVQGQETTVCRVKLSNRTPRTLDLVFHVSVRQPREGEALAGVRVPPGEIEWVVSELRPNLGFSMDAPSNPVKIDALELVDWCAVGASDPAAAADAFVPAYRSWVHWTKPFPSLTGRFAFVQRAKDAKPRSAAGTFRMDAAGAVDATLDGGSGGGTKEIVQAIADAFADLRRADVKDLTEKGALRAVADGVVEVEGAAVADAGLEAEQARRGRVHAEFTPNYTLRDGRIAASGDRTAFDQWIWTTQPMAGGYVVQQKRTPRGDWCYQYGYAERGGWIAPAAYRQYFGTVNGEMLSEVELVLDDVNVDAGGSADGRPAPAPAGPGAAALRQAWDAAYAYPDAEKTLTARFELRNPGTDAVWQGHRSLTGTVKLEGFRGFRRDGGRWRGYEADLTPVLPDAQERTLAWVVFDRLILWAGRDFAGRGPFDRAFAGATIDGPSDGGELRIQGGPYESATVKEGRIAALTMKGGVTRRFTWSKVGKHWVATRVQTGDEDLTVKFAPAGDGLVPVEMEFRAVFGKDWGPETVRLTNVRLE
jgi:hypothetical protein